MIDLERDLPVTPEDVEEQERIRLRRRGPADLDGYLEFLRTMNRIFPQKKVRKPPWRHFDEKFELP